MPPKDRLLDASALSADSAGRSWWRSPALVLAVLYVLVSTVWLVCSDLLVEAFVPTSLHPPVHTLKGIGFVLVTATLLYWRITFHLNQERRQAVESLSRTTRYQRLVKSATLRLSRSERRYESIFAAFPKPAFVYDRQSRRIVDANTAAPQQYGYSREELLELSIDALVGDASATESPNSPPAPGHSAAEAARLTPTLHRTKTGETFWASTATSSVQYLDRPACLVIVSDVTAMVLAKQRNETLRRKLRLGFRRRTRQLERARASLQSILDTMSRDMVGSLDPLIAHAKQLALGISPNTPATSGDTTSPTTAVAARLIGGLTRVRHLVEELTLLGTDSPPQADPVSLVLLVTRVLSQVEHANDGCGTRVKVVEPLADVTTSETVLAHVLASMLRAMLSAHPRVQIRIYATTSDRHVVLWIEDLAAADHRLPAASSAAVNSLRPLVRRIGGRLLVSAGLETGYRVGIRIRKPVPARPGTRQPGT